MEHGRALIKKTVIMLVVLEETVRACNLRSRVETRKFLVLRNVNLDNCPLRCARELRSRINQLRLEVFYDPRYGQKDWCIG